MSEFTFRLYGLTVSSQVQLPGFPVAATTENAWGFHPVASVARSDGGVVVRSAEETDNPDRVEVRLVGGAAYHLAFGDDVRFAISGKARRIEGSHPVHLSFEDALVYLVGPALGAAIRLEHRSVLHASAVDVAGRALLVMGEGGAGKSTLTTAFLDAGRTLITEDVAAIAFDNDGGPGVFRGGSRVKLWDDSVAGLRGRADALPALVPTNPDWTKKFLDASAQMTDRDVTPIASIVLLQRDDRCTTPRLDDMAPHDRVMALIANGYASRLVLPDDRANELARLSALARAVPVRRLVYPDDLKRLPDVVEFLARSC